MKIIAAFAVGLGLAALYAASAQAQNTRSFVSGQGSDLSNCSLASPCRTFQRAHDQTNAAGEIAVLNTAGYGAVTITKSISIVNPGGVEAGIAIPSGGTGITINAGPSDAVSLRGLILDGAGVGATGISFASGASLTIKNSVIRNLTSSGVALAPNVASTIEVSDTIVSNNGGHGIYLQPSGSFKVYAVFNRVEAYKNAQAGIGVFGNLNFDTRGAAIDCVAAHNAYGYYAFGGSSSNTVFRVFRSSATNNNVGLSGEAHGIIIVSQSQLEDNLDNWTAINLGSVNSYGDNYTDGESPPAGSPVSKH